MPSLRNSLMAGGGMVLLFVLTTNVIVPAFFPTSYSAEIADEAALALFPVPPQAMHVKTPEPLKALYMTSCVASVQSWRESLKELIKTTELNAVVIDIKDYTGTVSYMARNSGRG